MTKQLTMPLTVQDVMTADVLVVPETMTAGELAVFLTENEISGAPVVDPRGNAVGVVSLSDLARVASEEGGVSRERSNPDFYLDGQDDGSEWLRGWEESYNPEDLERLHVTGGGMVVRDFMTPTLHGIGEDATIRDVARLMVAGHLHRVLVLRDGKVVGIVTSMDLLELLAEGTGG